MLLAEGFDKGIVGNVAVDCESVNDSMTEHGVFNKYESALRIK